MSVSLRRASCQLAVSRYDVSPADTTSQPMFVLGPALDSAGYCRGHFLRRRHGYAATYVNDAVSWKKDSARESRSKFARRGPQLRWIGPASSTETLPPGQRP